MKIYEYPRSLEFHQFQTFPSNPMVPIEAKFHVEPPWEWEAKICSNGPGHVSKMAAMPIYDKTFNLLLWNILADVLETWYTALGTCVLPILFK